MLGHIKVLHKFFTQLIVVVGQIDDREMLGELVLSSSSEHLRKVISYLYIAITFV